jgi:hypothetical protein
VLPFTGGDALIYGHAISSEGGLDCVRPLMGVCPQFDVLWQQLSGREHLLIYGLVKGLSFDQVGAGSSFRILGRCCLCGGKPLTELRSSNGEEQAPHGRVPAI